MGERSRDKKDGIDVIKQNQERAVSSRRLDLCMSGLVGRRTWLG